MSIWRLAKRKSEDKGPPQIGLKSLFAPEAATIDVIFVHGLTGNRDKTWTALNAKQPWPETLLPSQIPKARIFTFGYDADVVHWRSFVSQNRVGDHASNLMAAVATERENDATNGRPIIFVAHSLGGIICEDALLRSRNSAEKHSQRVLDCTRGIVFLGTPHSGASLAVWAEALAKSVGLMKQTNSEILQTLQADSEVLSRIQTDFHTMLRARNERGFKPIKITCFFEELPLPGIGEVVPKHSAILPAYQAIGIHRNHKDMTKFENVEDPGFKSVAGELRRWMTELIPAYGCLPNISVPQERVKVADGEGSSHTVTPAAVTSSSSNIATRGDSNTFLKQSVLVDGGAGWTILHVLAYRNDMEGIERLLSLGKDPNCTTSDKNWTPLWVAANRNYIKVGELLLAAGAAVDIAADDGSTPLNQTALIGATEFSLLLLRHGAAVEGGPNEFRDTPLISAAAKGFSDTVAVMLAHGANCAAQQIGGLHALHYALLRNDEQMASGLLERDHATADLATQKGVKPLHLATVAGLPGVVRRLLAVGADIDSQDLGGLTAIRLAVQEGQLAIVELLLDAGAKVDLLPNDRLSLLKVANVAGHIDMVLFLEERNIQ